MASRDLVGGYNWVKDNAAEADIAKMVEKQKKNYAGNEILGKKLGVIGLGAIGAKVANVALKLGMLVIQDMIQLCRRCSRGLQRM